jgi:chondroitin AC lyase
MKKKLFQNFALISIVALLTFCLCSYSPFKKKNTGNRSTELIKKKEAGADLEIIRKRIIEDLLEPGINEKEIEKLVTTIKPDGSWPDINYIDTTRTGFQHSQHLAHMLDLSRALKKPGSKFYHDPSVKKTVSSALDFWIAHDFICQNWWWNEMGTPNWMINTLLVLDDDLTEKQRVEGARIANRANLEAFGARPGGDLIQIAGMLGKQALFKRDEAILQRVIIVMASEIKISAGRGLQPDMSFHHRVDNVISTLTYGSGFASAFSYWAVKIAGTKFTFPEAAMKLLIDYYLDGISKSMAFGSYPDLGAQNRDMSRKDALEKAGTTIPENLLKASNYRRAELEELIKIRKGEKKPALTWDRFFWHSEYFTHQRPSWFSSVRMHSNRQNGMEEPHNEEGLKMHHFADGSNFISLTGEEYFNIFPVWDWLKIPGATIVQSPSLPHWKEIAKKGLSEFVGGVSDGIYGATAFDFKSAHDPLKAHKAYFFFDNEYVSLGSGIASDAVYPVFTTINQCLLNNEVIVKTANNKSTLKKGRHDLKNVSWVSHGGVTYLFPSPVSLTVSNQTATGNWRQINHQAWATEEPVQKDVFSLWLDHGIKPQNAGYAYIVVPGINGEAIDNYKRKSEIVILANTTDLQAVQHKGLKTTEIVFYKEGSIKLSKYLSVTADSPCMVMVKTNGEKIEDLSVSDPTRKLTSLQLSVNTKLDDKGEHWHAAWNKEKKLSVIQIDLPKEGYAGQTVVLNFNK